MSESCYVCRPYTYSTHISACIQGHCEHESTNIKVSMISANYLYSCTSIHIWVMDTDTRPDKTETSEKLLFVILDCLSPKHETLSQDRLEEEAHMQNTK